MNQALSEIAVLTLTMARDAIHRLCLERGSTEGYANVFARINGLLRAEPATRRGSVEPAQHKPRLLACDNCGHHGLHGDDYPMPGASCPLCQAGTMSWWMPEPHREAVGEDSRLECSAVSTEPLTPTCSHGRRVEHDLRLGWRHVDGGQLCDGEVTHTPNHLGGPSHSRETT
jgi:hypothetical protein